MNESFVLYLPTYSLRFKLFRSIDQWYLHSLASWWIIRRRLLFSPPPLSILSQRWNPFSWWNVSFHTLPIHTHARFPRISVNDGKVDWFRHWFFPCFSTFFFFCELGFRKVGKTAIWLNVSPQFRNDEGSPCHDWYAFHARIPTEDHRFKWLN